MHNIKIFLLLLFIGIYFFKLNGQNSLGLVVDTFKGPFICDYYTESNTKNKNIEVKFNSKSLQWFNYLQREGQEYVAIGSLGSASYFVNNTSLFQAGFVLRRNTHIPYEFSMQQIKYYTTNKPFVELNFNFGANSTIIVDATHSQSINKHQSLGIHYQRIAAAGAFNSNNSLINNTSLYYRWTTKNFRYFNTISFILNDMRNIENGGVKNSKALNIINTNKLFQSTQLEKVNNTFYNTNWQIDQVYLLKRYDKDSTSQNFHGNDYARLTLFYKNELNRYYDGRPDSIFYLEYPHKKGVIENKYFENKIGLKTDLNIGILKNKMQFNPYFIAERLSVLSGNVKDSTYRVSNLFIGATVNFRKLTKDIIQDVEFQKGIAGYNISDLMIGIKGSWQISSRFGSIQYQIQYARKAPNYVQNFLFTDTISIANDFSSTNNIIGFLQYGIGKKFKQRFSATYQLMGNYIYLDSTLKYHQANEIITIFSMAYTNHFTTRNFGWKNDIVYQLNQNVYLPTIPLWVKTSIYYKGFWFKKNLDIQFGTDLRFTSSFNMPGYSPILSDFYYQQHTSSTPVAIMDVFVNAQIRTVGLSIKYNDVLEGLFGVVNFNALNYPTQGRGMDLFIKWRFLN